MFALEEEEEEEEEEWTRWRARGGVRIDRRMVEVVESDRVAREQILHGTKETSWNVALYRVADPLRVDAMMCSRYTTKQHSRARPSKRPPSPSPAAAGCFHVQPQSCLVRYESTTTVIPLVSKTSCLKPAMS